MQLRILAASTLAVTLALAAASATGARTAAPAKQQKDSITVWLSRRAEQLARAVAAATSAFKAKNPDVDVSVQYQGWGDHMTKFDASLASGNAPDVSSSATPTSAKYIAAGALADRSTRATSRTPAPGSRPGEVGHVQRQALRRPLLRGRPRRHLPHGLLQGGRDQDRPVDASTSSTRTAHKLMAKYGKKDPQLLGRLLPRPVLVRGDVVRLRLRRADRQVEQGGKWVGTLDSSRRSPA